jgi:23S rRNA (cytosine1962-C5)-methyltransferase
MTIKDYLNYNCKDTTDLVSRGVVTIRKREGREFKAGGAWIYDNEIGSVEGAFPNGSIVTVRDFDGYFLGYGCINLNSKIRVRMLSRREEDIITPAFLYQRVKAAWEYRKSVIDTSSCRVIFGEADFLPGLTVDKYETVLVVESLALGLEVPTAAPLIGENSRFADTTETAATAVPAGAGSEAAFTKDAGNETARKDNPATVAGAQRGANLKTIALSALVQVLAEDGIAVTGIYERSDAKVREKEGLERSKGFLSEEFDTKVPITENGIHYIVDVKDGQKTGFFLDQKLNRLSIHSICRNAGEVLDCFTHTGSFGLNAAIAGARHVVSIDASELAITQARENARLNGLDERIDYVIGDVFDFLPKEREAGKQYDVVILDPPAFTKSRNSVKAASHGYREINADGLRLVKDGGFLATCSCSHFMEPELFREAIAQAAKDAHKRLRQVEFRQQAPDHPILWANDASYYLKFYIFQVVDEK